MGLDLRNDHALALEVACTTADALGELQSDAITGGRVGWGLETAGDRLGHEKIAAALAKHRPGDGFLSEEGEDDLSRVSESRTWIVDPLDGSSGFGVGAPEWAVHVAMASDGAADVGAVAVPGLGIAASTWEPHSPPLRDAGQRPVVVTGRSRAWKEGQLIADVLDGELLAVGSAGYKAMMVLTGRADVYVHDAPLFEWDICAPAAVAQASGLVACDTQGNELVFNKPRPVVQSVMISRPEYAETVLRALSHHN